jgi:hypothetical protein
MEFIIIGLVSAFNLLVIKFKFDRKRYEDAILDLTLMIVLAVLFQGTYAGMVVAMVGSLVISIFLFLSPPTITNKFKGFFKEQIDDLNSQFEIKGKKKLKTLENFNL